MQLNRTAHNFWERATTAYNNDEAIHPAGIEKMANVGTCSHSNANSAV
jgi:hypothetical protein